MSNSILTSLQLILTTERTCFSHIDSYLSDFYWTQLWHTDGYCWDLNDVTLGDKDEYTHSGSTLFFHGEFGNLECDVVKFGQAYDWS